MERTGNATKEAARLFHELNAHCEAANTRAREQLRLNATDFSALTLLFEHGDLGPAALARALRISSASITAVLDRLEGQGYISRSLHPTDRRRSSIVVNTALIEGPIGSARALLGDADEAINSLPAPVREQLLAFLRQLSSRMRQTISQLTVPAQHQRSETK